MTEGENANDAKVEDAVESEEAKVDVEISESAGIDKELMSRVEDAEGRALRAQAELENFRPSRPTRDGRPA